MAETSGIPGRFWSATVCLWLIARALAADTVVVGSKNFEESRLLAEIFSQLLEIRTELTVDRRFGLAGTQVCFEALRRGAIDLYPEYTGTGLASLLGETPSSDPEATFRRVRRVFLEHWDLWWMEPLGFENAYELAVPRVVAERYGLRRISDLEPVAADLRAGLGYEFVERPDGLPGLERIYGFRFGEVRRMQQGLKYRAAGAGEIEVLDVYTTDGRLESYDLRILEDDRGFFPPYQAAPLARAELLREHPEVGLALGLLTAALDESTMRSLNRRLQEGGESERVVAASALTDLALVAPGAAAGDSTRDLGLLTYLWSGRRDLLGRTRRHLALTAAGVILGIVVAVPLGLILERRRSLAEPVIRTIGLTQTVPSIALLAFMIPLLGVGVLPAVVALWIYSLFPILRNTYTGVRDADPNATAAGLALGMTTGQVLRQVRLPLAAPVIMAGIRTAAVITVGTATLAAFIGAGGLGEPIVTGLQLADTRLILSGALPAALLALLVDLGLGRLERWLRPYSGDHTL